MRRLMPTALALALLLVGADTALWAWATGRLLHGYARWRSAAEAQGWRIGGEAPARGGWPFRASRTLPRFSIAGGEAVLPGGVGVTADRIELVLQWSRRLLLRPEGTATLRVSAAPALAFGADSIEALVGPAQAGGVDIAARGLEVWPAVHGRPGDLRISALTLHLDPAQRDAAGRTTAGASVAASGIGLPDSMAWPLGGAIGAAAASAVLSSPPPAGTGPAAEAAAWRDGGGAVAIPAFNLRWGPLSAVASGRFGLDARLQPAGSLTADLAGYGAAIDALAASGRLSPGAAVAARAVLGLMARPDGHVRVPLSLENDTLRMGRIPLLRFRDLDWGRP
jgi:hypothetical protein